MVIAFVLASAKLRCEEVCEIGSPSNSFKCFFRLADLFLFLICGLDYWLASEADYSNFWFENCYLVTRVTSVFLGIWTLSFFLECSLATEFSRLLAFDRYFAALVV